MLLAEANPSFFPPSETSTSSPTPPAETMIKPGTFHPQAPLQKALCGLSPALHDFTPSPPLGARTMVSEEPAHLVDAPKTCTLCKLAGMHMFLYNNNNNLLQPRYECLGCGHQFTHGGVAYKKKNRKKFRARASPSSRPPPPRPPSPSPPSSPHSPPASLAQSSPSALASEPAASPIRPRSPSAADHEREGARMARDAARLPVEVEAAGPSDAQVVTGVRVTRASPSPPPGSPTAHPGSPSSLGLEPAAAAPRPRRPSAADRERARARMATDAAKLPVEVEGAGPSGAQVVTGVRVTRASPSPHPASPSPHPASSSAPPASPIRPRFPSAADRERARARMARDAAMLPVEIEGADPSGAEVVTGVRVTRAASGVMPELPPKLMYQVRIKVSGADDVVRCVLMDLESGIPDSF